MNRMNTLLRASLEASQPVEPTDPMASLEDYLEYRAALEEHTEMVDTLDKVADLSEGLIEIEGLIDESRNDNDLSEDQVAMQVDAVNAVRAVIDGDVSEISMEHYDSALAASLEASGQSKGLLKRMWDAFVAMLAKIKAAFKKVLAWITGSSKRTEAAAKSIESAAKEIAAEEKATPPAEKPTPEEVKEDVAELTVALAKAPSPEATAKVEKAVRSVSDVIDDAKAVVSNIYKDVKTMEVEIEKGAPVPSGSTGGSNTPYIKWSEQMIVPTEEAFMRSQQRYIDETHVLISEYLEAVGSAVGSNNRFIDVTDANFVSECATELSDAWKRYPNMIGDITDHLRQIEEVEEILENASKRIQGNINKEFGPPEPTWTLTHEQLLNRVKRASSFIQKAKSDLLKIVSATESGMNSAKVATGKVAAKVKGRKNRRKR